jgi:hypothetical protein
MSLNRYLWFAMAIYLSPWRTSALYFYNNNNSFFRVKTYDSLFEKKNIYSSKRYFLMPKLRQGSNIFIWNFVPRWISYGTFRWISYRTLWGNYCYWLTNSRRSLCNVWKLTPRCTKNKHLKMCVAERVVIKMQRLNPLLLITTLTF